MLVLLPPSEGKTPATGTGRLDLGVLSFNELSADRKIVVDTLAKVSAHEDALAMLGVGRSIGDQVERNTRLFDEPVAPAHEIYSGVLYDALGYQSMTPAARQRAESGILIFSAAFGVVTPTDRIPAYRLAMGTSLPGLGRMSSWWKQRLAGPVSSYAEGHFVIDCRSAEYAAAWKAPAGGVAVRVFKESDGKRSVVSHMAKRTRGELARTFLVRGGPDPETPQQLLDIVSAEWSHEPDGRWAELQPGTGRRPASLDVILPG